MREKSKLPIFFGSKKSANPTRFVQKRYYMPMAHTILAACLFLALAFVLLFTSASASLPRQPKPVGASVTPIITATTSTSTVPATNTSRPTETPTATSTACPIQFSDVPPGSTYYDYVRCLACRGMISGYPDGTFRPGDYVTRGQACKIITNTAEITYPIPPDTQTFEDVPPGSTFWLNIEQAVLLGHVRGYPCDQRPDEPCVPPVNRPYFRPGANATRAQVTSITYYVSGISEPCSGEQYYEDVVNAGDPFWCPIQILTRRGVIAGYPCGGPDEPCVSPGNLPYYRPGISITRGQSAKMVARTFLPDCDTPLDNR